jgi:uncharacterized protein
MNVVTDNPDRERYELHVDGDLAGFAEYRGRKETRSFTHTEIDERFEGQGLGGVLVSAALDDVRANGMQVIPICPFVKSYLQRHPEYVDLVDEPLRAAFGL